MEMKTEQKRVEHIKSSSAREIHSTKFHTFFFFEVPYFKKKSERATNKCFNDMAQNVENKSKPNPNPIDGKTSWKLEQKWMQ